MEGELLEKEYAEFIIANCILSSFSVGSESNGRRGLSFRADFNNLFIFMVASEKFEGEKSSFSQETSDSLFAFLAFFGNPFRGDSQKH